MTRFFVLHPLIGSSDETEFEKLAPVRLGNAPLCQTCSSFVGPKPWLPPYRAIVEAHGEEIGDIAFGVGSSLLVSDAFRRAWEVAGLRGIARFAAVEALRIRPARLSNTARVFFQVLIEYGSTSIDEQRSIIERSDRTRCEQCKTGGLINSVRGFAIAENTWSGEDVFYAWGLPGTIIVTQRVKQLVGRHGLKNVHVTGTEDYVWDPLKNRIAAS